MIKLIDEYVESSEKGSEQYLIKVKEAKKYKKILKIILAGLKTKMNSKFDIKNPSVI